MGKNGAFLQITQDGKFEVRGFVDGDQFRGEADGPAGGGLDLVGCDAGVKGNDSEFTSKRVRAEEAEVGYDRGRTFSGQTEPLAVVTAISEAD